MVALFVALLTLPQGDPAVGPPLHSVVPPIVPSAAPKAESLDPVNESEASELLVVAVSQEGAFDWGICPLNDGGDVDPVGNYQSRHQSRRDGSYPREPPAGSGGFGTGGSPQDAPKGAGTQGDGNGTKSICLGHG